MDFAWQLTYSLQDQLERANAREECCVDNVRHQQQEAGATQDRGMDDTQRQQNDAYDRKMDWERRDDPQAEAATAREKTVSTIRHIDGKVAKWLTADCRLTR